VGKYIFKKAIANQVPAEVLDRRKQGFAVPLNSWFRGELRELTHESLFAVDDGILDRNFLRKIWDQHQNGTYDRSSHLWAVLMYRKWRLMFQA
jgi:asparagine synthase (glutamine-hydrolysing)